MNLLKIFFFIYLYNNLVAGEVRSYSRQPSFNAEKSKWFYLLSFFSTKYVGAKCITKYIPVFNSYYLYRHHTVPCDKSKKKCTYTVYISRQQSKVIVVINTDHTFLQTMNVVSYKCHDFVNFNGIGYVNENFARSFYKIWQFLAEILKSRHLQHYKVYLVGYSYGGALSTLLAAKLHSSRIKSTGQITLYTYGSPRVGNPDFARYFMENIIFNWRVVVNKDPVPHYPKCSKVWSKRIKIHPKLTSKICNINNKFSYYHHGIEIWYPYDTHILNSYRVCCGSPKYEDAKCSNKYHFDKTSFFKYKFFHFHYYDDIIQVYKSIMMSVFGDTCEVVRRPNPREE